MPISADVGFHRRWISELLALQPAELHLHQVGRNQRKFIAAFGAKVLGRLDAA